MFTEPKRRLVAIVSADVAGYSRLMGKDEEGTLQMLNAARTVFREHIDTHGGRIVDTAGDSVLAVFDSVIEALETTLDIQHALVALNAELSAERSMLFRIGINLGDVLEQSDGTIYGDGVNIAARVQSLAEPGGITVSGAVHDFVGDRCAVEWHYLGEQKVKNIERPVRVYSNQIAAGSAVETAPVVTISPPAQSLPARPSIAVLPFANMSGNADDEYFADGISEDIITELSRFRELIVSARNSTFSFKGRALKAQEVGQELNVRYILEGSVRKSGDRVRISAQLISAATGHHIWAERFDRKLEDVFAVQDEVTMRIVATLVGKLNDSERARARSEVSTENPAAYDLVLRGREVWMNFNREDNLAARGLYLQAIKLDPEFARAYSSLAWTYIIAYNEHWTDEAQSALDRALEYAQRSVYMDPASHSFRLALGQVYFFRKDLEKAIECFQFALELNVNDSDCYTFLAQALSLNGENEKALELLDHAFEINPYLGEWPRALYIVANFNARRYADGLVTIEKLHSPAISNYRWIAATYAALGRSADADAAAEKYFETYPDFDFADHVARVPFTHDADREHYAAALRAAGFEREIAAAL
jgi:adenylate cyclase